MHHDWKQINPHRAAWIERFNKEIRRSDRGHPAARGTARAARERVAAGAAPRAVLRPLLPRRRWRCWPASACASTPQLEGVGLVQYAKFAGDPFNWSVLGQTLLLGVKTVALTACIGLAAGAALPGGAAARAAVPPLRHRAAAPHRAWWCGRSRGSSSSGAKGSSTTSLTGLGLDQRSRAPAPHRAGPRRGALADRDAAHAVAADQRHVAARPEPEGRLGGAGRGRWRTLFRVILPLSLPGLLGGVLLVFASSVTAFVSQTIIGGGRMVLLPFYLGSRRPRSSTGRSRRRSRWCCWSPCSRWSSLLNALGRRSRALVHG